MRGSRRLAWRPAAVLATLLLTGLCGAQTQVCHLNGQPASTPSARFTDQGDGTVIDDGPAQLMWMRCAVGQRWRGGTCEGQATRHSWAQAQALAEQLNASGEQFYNDWRVPSLRELALVAERQCRQPRINLEIFPATPPVTFWTRSASARQPEQAYALDFGSEGVVQAARESMHAVRLVRSAP